MGQPSLVPNIFQSFRFQVEEIDKLIPPFPSSSRLKLRPELLLKDATVSVEFFTLFGVIPQLLLGHYPHIAVVIRRRGGHVHPRANMVIIVGLDVIGELNTLRLFIPSIWQLSPMQ
jgi:hypothetical protein